MYYLLTYSLYLTTTDRVICHNGNGELSPSNNISSLNEHTKCQRWTVQETIFLRKAFVIETTF